jgi:hypothetical protein
MSPALSPRGSRVELLISVLVPGLLALSLPASAQPQPSFSVQPLAPAQPPPAAAPAAPARPAAPPAAPRAPRPAPAADAPAAPTGSGDAPDAAERPAAAPRPARPRLPASERPAVRTPAAVTPRPTPAVKLGPVLSKAEVFARSAPATVILIASHENRWSTALGVVVSPQGVVVSDSRLLSGVEKGKVHGFLYNPALSGDEDPLLYLRAHMPQAVELSVVRIDYENHLLMMQLPTRGPKEPYRFFDLNDTQGVNVGLDVVVLRTRGRQTLAMMTGTIAAMRPDMIEVDPPLTIEMAGGPVLTQSGRLLGIATFSDKAMHASGQARPVDRIRDLLAGRIGTTPEPSAVPSVMEAPAESRNAVEAVRIGLGTALGLKMDKKYALRLHSEFVSAMGSRGRAVLRDIESVKELNDMIKTLTRGSDPKGRVVAEYFPNIVIDRKDMIHFKAGTMYKPVPGGMGGRAAVDDVTGALYATDSKRQLIFFDVPGNTWRISGLSSISEVRASGGSIYALLNDGHLVVADAQGKNSMQLFPKAVRNGRLEVSQGVVYLISDDDSVYRYRNKKWDQKGQPIAFAMKRIIARGENWYGLDGAGRIFASTVQRYIDRDGNTDSLWGVGRDLLVLTRDLNRFYYNNETDSWGPWQHW